MFMAENTVEAGQATRSAAQASAVSAPVEESKPTQKKSRKKVAKPQVVFAKSKRKESVARASGRKGSGIVRVNSRLISVYEPRELRAIMLRPIYVSDITRDLARGIDITVNVNGGGVSSQAQAVSGAIARVIMGFAQGDTVKKEYLRFERSLVIDDPRRVEPKKFRGPKARARTQTSYR